MMKITRKTNNKNLLTDDAGRHGHTRNGKRMERTAYKWQTYGVWKVAAAAADAL